MASVIQDVVSIPAPFNMILLIVLIVVSGTVLSEIAKQIRKFAAHRQELEFKRDLLDRGLPGDEIERIVAAHGANVDK